MTKDRQHIDVWERHGKARKKVRYKAPYYFYMKDSEGAYKDLHGNNLSKKTYTEFKDFFKAREEFRDRNVKLYESDISPIYKVLSNNYYNKEVGELNVSYFDIEVDYDDRGFPRPENPYAPVSAISLYHQYSDRMMLFVILPDNGKWSEQDIPVDLFDISEIIVCKTEKELLLRFLDEIENSDIISGWNSNGYDIPYLYKRMCERYSKAMADRLSFPDAPPPREKEVEVFVGTMQLQVDIFGRCHLDYLDVFKKFETTTRPSFTLDAISEEILPELKKLEYEGTLRELYYDDFPKFCRYNVRDTEVLKGFEEKLGYMGIAIATYHSATTQINDVLGTIKIVESTIINKCHNVLNVIVPDTEDHGDSGGKFAGALVLYPNIGMHEWVASTDFSSLYPSVIRTLNISPEKIIGQFFEDSKAYEAISEKSDKRLTLMNDDGSSETHLANEWGKILESRSMALSAHGTVFDQTSQGFIPEILEEWYNERKLYKKNASEAKKKMKELKAKYNKGN